MTQEGSQPTSQVRTAFKSIDEFLQNAQSSLLQKDPIDGMEQYEKVEQFFEQNESSPEQIKRDFRRLLDTLIEHRELLESLKELPIVCDIIERNNDFKKLIDDALIQNRRESLSDDSFNSTPDAENPLVLKLTRNKKSITPEREGVPPVVEVGESSTGAVVAANEEVCPVVEVGESSTGVVANSSHEKEQNDNFENLTVQFILAHDFNHEKKLVYYIKCYNYKSGFWLDEQDMIDCDHCIFDYWSKEKLMNNDPIAKTILSRLPDHIGKGGCIDNRSTNTGNLCTINEILNFIQVHSKRHAYKATGITFKEFNGFIDKKQDGIYIHLLAGHFYVYMYLKKMNKCFVADGQNLYHNRPMYREMVNFHLKNVANTIVAMKFLEQARVDHCASSAALIALEFMRLSKHSWWPKIISSGPFLRKMALKKLAPCDSIGFLDKTRNLNTFIDCPNSDCKRRFHLKQTKRFTNHLRACLKS